MRRTSDAGRNPPPDGSRIDLPLPATLLLCGGESDPELSEVVGVNPCTTTGPVHLGKHVALADAAPTVAVIAVWPHALPDVFVVSLDGAGEGWSRRVNACATAYLSSRGTSSPTSFRTYLGIFAISSPPPPCGKCAACPILSDSASPGRHPRSGRAGRVHPGGGGAGHRTRERGGPRRDRARLLACSVAAGATPSLPRKSTGQI